MKMTNKKNEPGFSLIELLIVILIINILGAAEITVYVGVQDKARRSTVVELTKASVPELQHWLQSSISLNKNIREIDTNFSGHINPNDNTNGQLFNNVATLYTAGRNTVIGDISPWFNIPLWNTTFPPAPGTISLTQTATSQLRLASADKLGSIMTDRTIAVD